MLVFLNQSMKNSIDQEGNFWHPHFQMTKDQPIFVIKKILGADADPKFLAKL